MDVNTVAPKVLARLAEASPVAALRKAGVFRLAAGAVDTAAMARGVMSALAVRSGDPGSG